jgi:hypothetical protein
MRTLPYFEIQDAGRVRPENKKLGIAKLEQARRSPV